MRARTGPREVTSIFNGGGTPSTDGAGNRGLYIGEVARNWTVPAGIEVTLEANPSLGRGGAFSRLSRRRQPRLCWAWRSMTPICGSSAARTRFRGAPCDQAGAREIFPRLSFRSHLCAASGQTPEGGGAERAIGHAADHLSLYQLAHRGRYRLPQALAARKFEMPVPDLAADLSSAHAGNHCVRVARWPARYRTTRRPGAESRHNLVYWRVIANMSALSWRARPLRGRRHAHRHHRRKASRRLGRNRWSGRPMAIIDERLSRGRGRRIPLMMGLHHDIDQLTITSQTHRLTSHTCGQRK